MKTLLSHWRYKKQIKKEQKKTFGALDFSRPEKEYNQFQHKAHLRGC